MRKIDSILIGTYSGDSWVTRICIASIRYWYPNIEINIYKDIAKGDFPTSDMEKYWNIGVKKLERDSFGSPYSKIFVNFLQDNKRILLLDSDIVFAGPVLDVISDTTADFVVSGEFGVDPNSDWFKRTYYDYRKIKLSHPNFRFPGYSFNGGQIILTTGVLGKENFLPFVNLESRPITRDSSIFPLNEQSIYNFLLPSLAQAGRLTLDARKFMIWGNDDVDYGKILEAIQSHDNKFPVLIHWAGTMGKTVGSTPGHEILDFFQSIYFSRLRFGKQRRQWQNLVREIRWGRGRKMLSLFMLGLKR